MSKLTEWVLGLNLYTAVWLMFVKMRDEYPILKEWEQFILYFPVITVAVFGISCLMLVLWRVYRFNDCKEAAAELQEEIKLAKEDLKKKGFKF